jgi:hypothetical protein
MRVIKITEGHYARTKAIRIVRAEIGLAAAAPAEVRAAWDAKVQDSGDYFQNMLLPTIKVSLIANEEVIIYFASDEARDKRLAELIAEWQGE